MPVNTPTSLGQRGVDILTNLCITKDFTVMAQDLVPNLEVIHDDNAPGFGRDSFIEHFKAILKHVPDFTYDIKDHVAQVDASGSGGKVWVFSRLKGLPGGKEKDSVDMLEINGEGLLTKTQDVQRLIGA